MCPHCSLFHLVTLISVQTPSAAAGFELQYRWNDVQIKKHFTSPMLASLSLSRPPGDPRGGIQPDYRVWLHCNRALPLWLSRIVLFPSQEVGGSQTMSSVARSVVRNSGSVFLGATFMAQHGCLASSHVVRISFEGDFWKSQRTESQEHTS